MAATPSVPILFKRPLVLRNTIKLVWSAPLLSPAGPILEYRVQCTNPVLNFLFSPTTNFYMVTGLNEGQEYTFTIQARSVAGWGAVATWPAVMTGIRPGNISDLSGNAAGTFGLDVRWSLATDDGNSDIKHQVMYATAFDLSGNRVASNDLKRSLKSNATSGFIKPCVANRVYTVKVQAVNDVGYSENSPTINISTLALFNQVNISTFSDWHASNASSIAISAMPTFYRYLFDGGANSITDGGDDMWDNGNFISLGGFTTISNMNYGASSNFMESNSGYFLTGANVWPQIGMAYCKSGTITWSNGGGLGSDGGGQFSNMANIGVAPNTYTTPSGRSGYWWANQNYAASDPTICYMWFTIDLPTSALTITSSNDGRKTNVNDSYNQSFSVTGTDLIFCQTLLSISSGQLIASANLSNFVTSYVEAAQIDIS
jgi:hypothetical protein